MKSQSEEKTYPSFEEFWPFYLSQHRNRTCRNLHFLGTTLGVAWFIKILLNHQWQLLPFCFILGYGFSWVGHFVFEKNRPATFTYPKWSFQSDFKMLGLFYSGKLEAELKKYKMS